MYLSLKTGDLIFKYCYPLYKILYPAFKHRQDKQEIEFLKQIIKPGHTIIDIGANIGFYAEILSDLTGENGKLICFEPDPVNFTKLKENTKGKKNTTLYQYAVSDKPGTISFYLSHRLNVDHRSYKPEKFDREIQVEAVSLDQFLGAEFKADIIKIDIQGFELFAFKGMENMLSNNPDLIIVSEFWPYGLKASGTNTLEFFNFFAKSGFTLYLMEEKFKPLNENLADSLRDMPEKFYRNVLISKKFNPENLIKWLFLQTIEWQKSKLP